MSVVELIGYGIGLIALLVISMINQRKAERDDSSEEEPSAEPLRDLINPKKPILPPKVPKKIQKVKEKVPEKRRGLGELEQRKLKSSLEERRLESSLQKRPMHLPEEPLRYQEPRAATYVKKLQKHRDMLVYQIIMDKPKGLKIE